MEDGKSTPESDKRKLDGKYDIDLPQCIIDSFARFLVPEIRKFYESEEGQQEFAEWEAQQQNDKADT